jgi:hypothetical protein
VTCNDVQQARLPDAADAAAFAWPARIGGPLDRGSFSLAEQRSELSDREHADGQTNEEINFVEPISPELVLVDPELARVARSRLRDSAESLASPRRRKALRSSLDSVEASAQYSGEVRPGEGNLIEIKLLADSTDRDRVPMIPGKGERLRRAFEDRLTGR